MIARGCLALRRRTHVNSFCWPPLTRYVAAVLRDSPTSNVPLGTKPTFSSAQTPFWVIILPTVVMRKTVSTGRGMGVSGIRRGVARSKDRMKDGPAGLT